MMRQKKVRDRKLLYEIFEPGNNVRFLPCKEGRSFLKTNIFLERTLPKKLSDVLYEIKCGDNTNQIIHCN